MVVSAATHFSFNTPKENEMENKKSSRWDNWQYYPQVETDPAESLRTVMEIMKEGVEDVAAIVDKMKNCPFKAWREDGRGGWKYQRAYQIPTMEMQPALYVLSPDFLRAQRRGIVLYANGCRDKAEAALKQYADKWRELFSLLKGCIKGNTVESAWTIFDLLEAYMAQHLVGGKVPDDGLETAHRYNFNRFRLRLQKLALMLFDVDNTHNPNRRRIWFVEQAFLHYDSELLLAKLRHTVRLSYFRLKGDFMAPQFAADRVVLAIVSVLEEARLQHPIYAGMVKDRNTSYSPGSYLTHVSALADSMNHLLDVISGPYGDAVTEESLMNVSIGFNLMLGTLFIQQEKLEPSHPERDYLFHFTEEVSSFQRVRKECTPEFAKWYFFKWRTLFKAMFSDYERNVSDDYEARSAQLAKKRGSRAYSEKIRESSQKRHGGRLGARQALSRGNLARVVAPKIKLGPWASSFVLSADQNSGAIRFKNREIFYIGPAATKAWADLRLLLESTDPQGWALLKRNWAGKFFKTDGENTEIKSADTRRITAYIWAEGRGRNGTGRFRLCDMPKPGAEY